MAIQAIRSVLEFAEDNAIDEIDTVVLEIGELSMVVPEYMEEAWYAAVKNTMLEKSRLQIDVMPGNGLCENCGQVYNIVENKGVCPKCGSRNLTKIDRMNGYLSYSRVHGDTRLNDAKMAEIAERKSM